MSGKARGEESGSFLIYKMLLIPPLGSHVRSALLVKVLRRVIAEKRTRSSMGQHWVDRAYLESWCDPACPANHTPFVWIFEKHAAIGRKRAPKKIFKESHIYTDDKAADPLYIEKGLKTLLDDYLRVRDNLIFPGRKITHQDVLTLSLFASSKLARTQALRDRMRKTWGGLVKATAQMLRADQWDANGDATIGLKLQDGQVGEAKLSELEDLAKRPADLFRYRCGSW